MSTQTNNFLLGISSYLALFLFVWFAVRGAPAWLVLFCALGNGTLLHLALSYLDHKFSVQR